MVDQFDTPMTDEEKNEVRAMPSHEVYFLTKMVPPASVRGREVKAIYLEILDGVIASSQEKP